MGCQIPFHQQWKNQSIQSPPIRETTSLDKTAPGDQSGEDIAETTQEEVNLNGKRIRAWQGHVQEQTLQGQKVQGTEDRTGPEEVEPEERKEEQDRPRIDGNAILAELERRDRAYYYWSILAFIFSFLPFF